MRSTTLLTVLALLALLAILSPIREARAEVDTPDTPDTPDESDLPDLPDTPDMPDDDTSDNNNTNTTTPIGEGGIGEGQHCGNTDKCGYGLVCVTNECRLKSTLPESTVSGTGNTCSAQDCCPAPALRCNTNTQRCVPAISELPIIECTKEGGPPSSDEPNIVDGNSASSASVSVPLVALAMVSLLAITSRPW